MWVLARSADLWSDLWSAVSPTLSRQAYEALGPGNLSCAPQTGSLRYSRPEVCATGGNLEDPETVRGSQRDRKI
jgi:hypothetical protein